MRSTDDRYAGERLPFDLAIRMIGHEARTCTIHACTGLSDDRIRKLYATYFKVNGQPAVRRHRGKSPSCTTFFVKNLTCQSEASTLAVLFAAFDLLEIRPQGRPRVTVERNTVRFGNRFCQLYETYLQLHDRSHISFERAWSLFYALADGDELVFMTCRQCANLYVHDALAINQRCCPCCKLKDARH